MANTSFKWFSAVVCATGFVAAFQSTASAQLTILPLGDSLTDGYQIAGGYRTELDKDLTGAGINFTFEGTETDNASSTLLTASETHHEGHIGYRIDQINNNLTASDGTTGNNGGFWLSGGGIRPAISPNIVLLEIGTNDFTQNYGNADTNPASANARLLTLLGNLKTDLPNAQIFVASLIPRTDYPQFETPQEAYNALIPADVTAEGSNFHFVDLHAVVTPAEVAAGNAGVHPNQAGYDAMGDAWFSAIEAVPEPSTVPLVGVGLAGMGIGAFFRKRLLVRA